MVKLSAACKNYQIKLLKSLLYALRFVYLI